LREDCGCLLRDSEGEWIGGFSKVLGTYGAYVVELWGLYWQEIKFQDDQASC